MVTPLASKSQARPPGVITTLRMPQIAHMKELVNYNANNRNQRIRSRTVGGSRYTNPYGQRR